MLTVSGSDFYMKRYNKFLLIGFLFALTNLYSGDPGLVNYNRGNDYYHEQMYEKAIEEYSKAIALNNYDIDAYNNRGLAYYQIGLYDLALKDFDRVIAAYPDDIFAYQSRAITYNTIGKYKEANKDYLVIIKLNPDFAYSYLGILYTSYYISKNDFRNAYKFILKEKERFKNRPEVYNIFLFITGKLKEKELLKLAQNDDERLNDTYFTVAFNYLRKGWKRKAKEHFLKCRELNKYDSVEYFLSKLELSRLK